MKHYARILASLFALLVAVTLFSSCTKEGTTEAPKPQSSPSVEPPTTEEQPTPPQLDFDTEGSVPVFEW